MTFAFVANPFATSGSNATTFTSPELSALRYCANCGFSLKKPSSASGSSLSSVFHAVGNSSEKPPSSTWCLDQPAAVVSDPDPDPEPDPDPPQPAKTASERSRATSEVRRMDRLR